MPYLLFLLVMIASAASAQGDPAVRYVFFDWGKGELSNDSKAVLDKVAEEYAAAPGRLVVDGHSDRSGSADGNHRRSRERARLVSDYLSAKGVPAAQIEIRAYGETRLLIPTDDGVREVQNRRVEIRRGS